jgi:hypothetical protein
LLRTIRTITFGARCVRRGQPRRLRAAADRGGIPEITDADLSIAMRSTGADGGISDLKSNAPVVMIPREVGQKIEDALEAILARVERIEQRLDGRRPH